MEACARQGCMMTSTVQSKVLSGMCAGLDLKPFFIFHNSFFILATSIHPSSLPFPGQPNLSTTSRHPVKSNADRDTLGTVLVKFGSPARTKLGTIGKNIFHCNGSKGLRVAPHHPVVRHNLIKTRMYLALQRKKDIPTQLRQ